MEYDIRSFSQDPRGQKWTGWAGCGAIARASLDNNRDDAWADRQGVPLSFARRRSRFACVPRVITCTMSDRVRNELAARLRAAEARVWSLWQAGHVARPQQHHTKEEWRIPGLRSLSLSPALSLDPLVLPSAFWLAPLVATDNGDDALSVSVTSPGLINRSDVRVMFLLPLFLSLSCTSSAKILSI